MKISKIFPTWRFRRFANDWPRIRELAAKEFGSPIQVPFSIRLQMWRRGFLGESSVMYGLDRYSTEEYLSDFARFVRTADINGIYKHILANKILFDAVMARFGGFIPCTFGLIFKGKVQWLKRHSALQQLQDIESFCLHSSGLVLKPISGAGGAGIYFINQEEGRLHLQGKLTNLADIEKLLQGLNGYLIQERLAQAHYSAAIFPKTANTLRILTMWAREDHPFIAAAVHRFGTNVSYPVDNWTRGGLSVKVEIETGTLGAGATYPASGALIWHRHHPDTGAEITGIQVPNWETIKNQLLAITSEFPYLPYIGWDILTTHDGRFRIVEGNHRPDVNLLQVHSPLLKDPRVREFYFEQGVVPFTYTA